MYKNIIISIIGMSFIGMPITYAMPSFGGRIDAQVCSGDFPTFYAWKEACDALPRFSEYRDNPCTTPLTEQALLHQLNLFLKTIEKQISHSCWVYSSMPLFTDGKAQIFESYIEKIEIPTNAIVAMHGDLHGDVHAINRFIETFLQRGYLDEENPFRIKDKNFYMVFLGNYVDRGWYGPEVIYTILRLKNENRDRVFMVRGNHEDIVLSCNGYGFGDELQKKFSPVAARRLMPRIGYVYSVLPLALYVAAGMPDKRNVIQCCHGGIEIGVNPQPLLETAFPHACMKINVLMQADGFAHLAHLHLSSLQGFFKNNKLLDTSNGFMWTDFIVDHDKTLLLSPRDGESGTLFEYGKKATEHLLKVWSGSSYTLRAIFRGHQHDFDATPMRRRILNEDGLSHPSDTGVGKLWIANTMHKEQPRLLRDVSVVTFSVAPEAGYGWPFHSFGQLTVAQHYDDWRLEIFRLVP